MVVVVNPDLDQSGIGIKVWICMFDLAKVLRRMPFLRQTSVFIRAWDRQNKALACTPLRLHYFGINITNDL